ncbi:MAG: DNA-directed RNA polymerase subunit alpha C-terminal domain-containing protein, partial [Chloroflexota bacterium]
ETLEELDLSVRVYYSLRRAGIASIKDLFYLLYAGRRAAAPVRNFGEAALHRTLEALENKHCLPDDLPPDVDVRTQENRIHWLVATQQDNGSWFNHVEITTAALLAMIRTPGVVDDVRLDTGIIWLQQNQPEVEGSLLTYAVERVIAEFEQTVLPECPFPLPESVPPAYIPGHAGNLEDLRRIALIQGQAVKFDPGYDPHRPEHRLGPIYTYTEIAWMAVGKPSSH